jgi:hypothetical protein
MVPPWNVVETEWYPREHRWYYEGRNITNMEGYKDRMISTGTEWKDY